MPCQSCGKKHPLSRAQSAARHFTNMPRRRLGRRIPVAPKPPPPPIVEIPSQEGEQSEEVK